MNQCELKHNTHDIKQVKTRLGFIWVYDIPKYMGNGGYYCSGQDAISENLALEGQLEVHDTKVIYEILFDGDLNHGQINLRFSR